MQLKQNIIDVMIEIPLNSSIKYEFDSNLNTMRCDRVLSTSMKYPGNYGFIPKTLSGDGDPLDVLLICDFPILPGVLISSKIIGVLLTTDEKGTDEKIIAIPSPSVQQKSKYINDISDIDSFVLSNIKHFFTHYKDNDEDKWVTVDRFESSNYAVDVFNKSVKLYRM